eukprot:EG_transcript_10451
MQLLSLGGKEREEGKGVAIVCRLQQGPSFLRWPPTAENQRVVAPPGSSQPGSGTPRGRQGGRSRVPGASANEQNTANALTAVDCQGTRGNIGPNNTWARQTVLKNAVTAR